MKWLNSVSRLLSDPFKRTIRSKLIVIMISISVIPIIVVTWLATNNTRRAMEQEVIQSNLSRIDWAGDAVNNNFTQLNNLIYTILISPTLAEYTKEDEASLRSQFTIQSNIINTITSVYYSGNNNLVEIQLYYREKNKLFTINDMRNDIQSPPAEPPTWRELITKQADVIIQDSTGTASNFKFIRSINRFENQEKIGSVSLDVKWKMMDNALDLLNSEQEAGVYIVDSSGKLMHQLKERDLPDLKAINLADHGSGFVRTAEHYIFYNQLEPSGLSLIKVLPVSYIDHSAATTQKYGLIVGVASALVAALLAALLAYTVSRPIIRLARSMSGLNWLKAEDVSHLNRQDEIGMLEMRFHTMSSRIREHIRNEYTINLEKQTAQLKALQAQINPHFLQNTLQLIGSMSFSKTPSDIYSIIQSLSDMFRYCLREPGDLATIRAEMKHLSNYMNIQRQRFTGKLTYEADVAPEWEDCRIPKLSLQPLVENAFMHGFDKKKGSWCLKVKVLPYDSGLLISVEDNGIGISPSRLEDVRSRLAEQLDPLWTSGNSIGLYNVSARIKLYFGEEYGIHIENNPGGGTRVSLYIPRVKEGQ
ncbi:HAMP domain-containing protein [Paenibacillaceae bacterium]|nr:HAMP domain-containing protein [Paenibacillaceae bacterium]